jgi:hypothetical protein
LAAERKIVKEQKEEAERFKKKRKELARAKQHRYLWQLFHIEEEVKERQEAMSDADERLKELLNDSTVRFLLPLNVTKDTHTRYIYTSRDDETEILYIYIYI